MSAGPTTYVWEPTSESIAAEQGLPVETIVRFDTNTRPTPPEAVARVLARGAFAPGISEYPPSDYRILVEAASARYRVERDEILVGAGADEILDLVARASLREGDSAVVAPPTYAMYRVVTEQRGARVVEVPRLGPERGFALDTTGIRHAAAAGARLIWLCDPNNPTGTSDGPAAIGRLLDGLSADAARDGRDAPVVAIDEAYAEYAGTSTLPLLAEYQRLVVIRTLSKAYGIAGLRVGFGLARRLTLDPIQRFRPPSSVSTTSMTVGAALLRDPEIVGDAVDEVAAERNRLGAALSDAGWQVGPSVTNFLLVTFANRDAAATATRGLLSRGLAPRTFGDGHPLAACLRLTVRAPHENDRLVAAVRALAATTEAPR